MNAPRLVVALTITLLCAWAELKLTSWTPVLIPVVGGIVFVEKPGALANPPVIAYRTSDDDKEGYLDSMLVNGPRSVAVDMLLTDRDQHNFCRLSDSEPQEQQRHPGERRHRADCL